MIMITIGQGFKLSAIIDKIDIKIDDPSASQEKVGADLLMQVIKKLYKAQDEVLEFIAEYKNCTKEEASKLDLIKTIKEMAKNEGLIDFFRSAVKLE